MIKAFYVIGRAFELIGIIFTCISLLLFGRGGSMSSPMIAFVIGGVWFLAGWLIVKDTGLKLACSAEKKDKC